EPLVLALGAPASAAAPLLRSKPDHPIIGTPTDCTTTSWLRAKVSRQPDRRGRSALGDRPVHLRQRHQASRLHVHRVVALHEQLLQLAKADEPERDGGSIGLVARLLREPAGTH